MTDDLAVEKKESGADMDRSFGRLIPLSLREDISTAYSKMLSDDPTIKIPGTRSFMALLKTAVIINGDPRYDELITRHTFQAINALNLFQQENWAAAMEICYKVQEELGFLAYSGYGTSEKPANTSGIASSTIKKPAVAPAGGKA